VIDRALTKLKSEGVGGVARAVARRVIPQSVRVRVFGHDSPPPPEPPAPPEIQLLRCFEGYKPLFAGRRGLEIGGPSAIFSRDGIFPVYPLASRLDNCNFSRNTIWEGKLEAGQTFCYDPDQPPGWQYLSEAVDLREVESGTYDFVLSSHMLEHTANPLRALREWMRVVRDGGLLAIIVPQPEETFDRFRPVTSLAHVVEDFERGTEETDLTHLPEILKFHDLSRDPCAGALEEFAARSQRNYENRCLHHHVFNPQLVEGIMDYAGLQIRAIEEAPPFHIVTIAEKPKALQLFRFADEAAPVELPTASPAQARAKAA
jgi:SAM-dependent methyltransferase